MIYPIEMTLIVIIEIILWLVWELSNVPQEPFWMRMSLEEFRAWQAAGEPDEEEWARAQQKSSPQG